ncbi:MAG TPA: hypothetical protein VKF41_04580 [Bryobacteraceae bacterium]|nr:hypothetical protein [Bryobacteraceae bacterium]
MECFAFDYPGAALHPHAPGYAVFIRLDGSGNYLSGRMDRYDLRNGAPVADSGGAAYRAIRDLTWSNLKQTGLEFPGNGRVERIGKE